jgi:hypothetical protein
MLRRMRCFGREQLFTAEPSALPPDAPFPLAVCFLRVLLLYGATIWRQCDVGNLLERSFPPMGDATLRYLVVPGTLHAGRLGHKQAILVVPQSDDLLDLPRGMPTKASVAAAIHFGDLSTTCLRRQHAASSMAPWAELTADDGCHSLGRSKGSRRGPLATRPRTSPRCRLDQKCDLLGR